MTRILVVNPPAACSYFNAGHRLALFQVGAYLRALPSVSRVVCRDLGALNATWRDVCRLLSEPFDVIAIFNDLDGLDGLPRFVEYARALAPSAKLVTFGRAGAYAPRVLRRFGLDAIVESGDPEAGVEAYLAHLAGGPAPAGVSLAEDHRDATPGVWLPPERWILPDVGEIPYEAYDRLYAEDLDKFCGIPGRRELVVPVARGCPVGCDFCDVPRREGARERRIDVSRVVAYIDDAFARGPFEYVSFYAPTFTLRRGWVLDLCAALRSRAARAPWKCVTTTAHLDAELIAEMGASGCVRVSVGLETLGPRARALLPMLKQEPEARLGELSRQCRDAGIELNCFVILGLPGDTPEAAAYTIDVVRALGARVRPTLYTPYDRLLDVDDPAVFRAYNRQTFVGGTVSPDDAARYYRLAYGGGDRRTAVMQAIAPRGSGADDLLATLGAEIPA